MDYVTANYKMYAKISGAWADITADVIDKIAMRWGISGNAPSDRLADTGQLTMTLENGAGLYCPKLAGAMAGFGKGTPIKLVIIYDGTEYNKFNGVIDTLDIASGLTSGLQRVSVTVMDWMEYAANYPLQSPGVIANLRSDLAVDKITSNMPIQPLHTQYAKGDNVFKTVFDMATTTTRAYQEYSKIALSELGYIYLRKDKIDGETLVFESALSRKGTDRPTQIPLTAGDSMILQTEAGEDLLTEDGLTLVLDEIINFSVDNLMTNLKVIYGGGMVNRMTAQVYPRKLDSSPQVLFTLNSPLTIGAGETVNLRGSYADPIGGGRVNGVNMITPVATTDYLFNTAQDGTGTNITVNLEIIAVYGTEGVTYDVLKNNNALTGYVTKLQARGTGVYTYNPIETSEQDLSSINQYGYYNASINQQYQQDLVKAGLEVKKIVDQEKQPRTVLKSADFIANSNSGLMMAFLNLDIGDIIEIKENKTGIDAYYYIHQVAASVQQGGLINYTWMLKEMHAIGKNLALIGTESSVAIPGINFGYLPQVSNLSQRTFCGWVRINTNYPGYLMGNIGNGAGAGVEVVINGALSIVFYQYGQGDTQQARWFADGVILPNTWTHVCVTRDSSYKSNAPLFYLNGVLKSTYIDYPQTSETASNEDGCRFILMDWTVNTEGTIKDTRVYNRIITAAEVTAIYNNTSEVTDGLVFQAPCVRTSEIADYDGVTLTENMKLLDGVFGNVGTPLGGIIGRELPYP